MGKKFERELRGRMISLEELEEWKKKRDAVILAHYYVRPEVQALADYIGDSYFLSKKATELANKTIVLCGVTFMGESAKLLNPDKTVLMPDLAADCPMAHMVTKETVQAARDQYDDLAVVCYINSTQEIKSWSDVCVTSANAVKIVKNLPNKHILFIPARNAIIKLLKSQILSDRQAELSILPGRAATKNLSLARSAVFLQN
jgi:quinolinate synthase